MKIERSTLFRVVIELLIVAATFILMIISNQKSSRIDENFQSWLILCFFRLSIYMQFIACGLNILGLCLPSKRRLWSPLILLDTVRFLQEFCALSKNLQKVQQLWLFSVQRSIQLNNVQRSVQLNNLSNEAYHNVNRELRELPPVSQSSVEGETVGGVTSESTVEESNPLISNLEHSEHDVSTNTYLDKKEGDDQFQVGDTSELAQDDLKDIHDEDGKNSSIFTEVSNEDANTSSSNVEEISDTESLVTDSSMGQPEIVEGLPTEVQDTSLPITHGIDITHAQTKDDASGETSSLLDDYFLRDSSRETLSANKDLDDAIKDLNDAYISKDGKLVPDFLDAVHEAEKRQAEVDAGRFGEEKRVMKEKYEKELKDVSREIMYAERELMYAERVVLLEKKLDREKVKAAAALKSLQEKLEEKHKIELEEKDTAAELKLRKVQELAKAELNAAIASEKASQIEKMAEANVHDEHMLNHLAEQNVDSLQLKHKLSAVDEPQPKRLQKLPKKFKKFKAESFSSVQSFVLGSKKCCLSLQRKWKCFSYHTTPSSKAKLVDGQNRLSGYMRAKQKNFVENPSTYNHLATFFCERFVT